MDQRQSSKVQQPAETNDWEGVDNTVSDPEEARVIYSALDSFASVYLCNLSASIATVLSCSPCHFDMTLTTALTTTS